MRHNRPTGMFAFTLVWLGQLVSLLGTGMTQFAIALWAWELTGQATALALVGFFTFGPQMLLSPLAGALVDRWNRKLVMMLSDLAAGLATVVLLVLYTSNQLQIWHLYVAGAFVGAFQTFQFPAYSAAISTMLPKEQYARADAMLGLAESASGIFAPVAASFLYGIIGLGGIMTIDAITFIAAIAALLVVHVPQPAITEEGRASRGGLLTESVYGFRFIFARPSLFGLQMVFFFGNMLSTLAFTLLPPMILSRTDSDQVVLGLVQGAFGVGGVIGGLLLSLWGGPKRKVHGLLIGWTGIGIGAALLGMGQALAFWVAAAFATALLNPMVNSSNQAIWQAKVPPDVQGRVFSTRRLIAQVTIPIAMLLAGPLADDVFEPGMQAGKLAAFEGLVGSGPGAGMGLIFVICGILIVVTTVGAYAVRAIREAEIILPDHDAAVIPEVIPAAQ